MLAGFEKTYVQPVAQVLPVNQVAAIAKPEQDLAFRAHQFMQGQEYLAKILAKTDEGPNSYLVKVDNTLLKMTLQVPVDIGQSLPLKYLNAQPNPTFLLGGFSASAQKTGAQISQTGRLITQYLQASKIKEHGTQSAEIIAKTPMTQTPQNPAQIASGLYQSITQSGLFYESHLAKLTKGEHDVSQLLAEPQNRNIHTDKAQANQTVIQQLVSQQLSALDTGTIGWHGEVWPGQSMEWRVHVDPEAGNHSATVEATEAPVQSELRLTLPNLGQVRAKLFLHQGSMQIRLSAEDANTLSTMKQAGTQLANALGKLDMTLASLTLSSEEASLSADRLKNTSMKQSV